MSYLQTLPPNEVTLCGTGVRTPTYELQEWGVPSSPYMVIPGRTLGVFRSKAGRCRPPRGAGGGAWHPARSPTRSVIRQFSIPEPALSSQLLHLFHFRLQRPWSVPNNLFLVS